MTKIRNSPLDLHRQAWLDAHLDRDEKWLLRMAKEGFDVHHIDGNHDNDSPLNLVLIEHRDHFMLHSGSRPALGRVDRRAAGYARYRAKQKAKLAEYERDVVAPAYNEYERAKCALIRRYENGG